MTDSTATNPSPSESPALAPLKDVTRVLLPDGREVHLVGTAHVSRESVEAVRAAVETLGPDCVCVELDADRLQNLRHPTKWDSLNLSEAFRKGKGTFLLANLVLAAFQRKLGLHTGVRPGAELAEAVAVAEERDVPAVLVDRNIRTTLVRAWRRTGFWKKMWLVSSLAASAFDDTNLGEEELAELRQRDTLSVVLEEMGKILPSIKEILIDERDRYMAAKIQRAEGKNIVAVVGAGHVPGITRLLGAEIIGDDEIETLDSLPSKTFLAQAMPWLIPTLVGAFFLAGFIGADPSRIKEAFWAWVLATGLLSAAGTALALGHPLTVLSAFIAAPITTLHPALGAGMVTGAVQAWVSKPKVRDAEEIWNDLGHWTGWWKNRVGRVFLVFLFSSFGAVAGVVVAFRWLKGMI